MAVEKLHMKSCLTSLVTREMQNKTTRTYHYIHIGMLQVKSLPVQACPKHVEELGLPTSVHENVQWFTNFGKVSENVNYTMTI